MRALFVLGRAIFGGYFAWSGLNLFLNQETMSQYAAAKGVAAAEAAVPASDAMMVASGLSVAGGLSVAAGFKPRQGLALIVGFLVPVTLKMHRFWEVEDPSQRMSETINFSKNLALVGAALALMQLDEPWPVSVDAALDREEDMFVRLGGRDLRALPA